MDLRLLHFIVYKIHIKRKSIGKYLTLIIDIHSEEFRDEYIAVCKFL